MQLCIMKKLTGVPALKLLILALCYNIITPVTCDNNSRSHLLRGGGDDNNRRRAQQFHELKDSVLQLELEPSPGLLTNNDSDDLEDAVLQLAVVPLSGVLTNIDSDDLEDDEKWGHCEGDCGDDDDCEDGLVCYDRSGMGPVPGCTGEGEKGDSYCVEESAVSKLTVFRLKLYWERGYRWQGSRSEKKYCVQCEGSCHEGANTEIGRCGSSDDLYFEFLNKETEKTMIQIWNTTWCLQMGKDRDSDPAKIDLEPCDSSKWQQWYGRGDGDFDGKRFELRIDGGCVTQEHHPRSGEDLKKTSSCSQARDDDTSYWARY